MKKIYILSIVVIIIILIGGGIWFYLDYSSAPTLSKPSLIGLTNSSSITFSFSSSKAGVISYSGDCSSSTISAVSGVNSVVFRSLSDGNHTNCAIVVTNSAGKKSLSLAISSFVVDTSKPITNANLNGYTNGNFAQSVTIGFSCSDGGSSGCANTDYAINNGSVQQGNSVTFNSNGRYFLAYWSVDRAGNEEVPHTELNNIKIDLGQTPSPIINTSTGYQNQSFNLIYTPSNSNDNCYYTANGGDSLGYGSCSGTFGGVSFAGDSEYTLIVYENDSVGNLGSSGPITITWDTTPPAITLTSPVSGEYNSTTWPTVVLGNYADASTCQYSSDGSNWINFNSCSDTSNYRPNSGSGTLYVRGIDAAGNVQTAVSVPITYDS